MWDKLSIQCFEKADKDWLQTVVLYRKLQKFDEEIEKKYNLKQFDHKADTSHDFQQSALNRAKDVEKKTEHQSLLSYLLEHKEVIKNSATSWKDLQNKLLELDKHLRNDF